IMDGVVSSTPRPLAKEPHMTPLRRRMIEDMTLRNFTPKSIQAYVRSVARFARHFDCSPDRLGPEHVRSYLLYLLQERGASLSYYNQTRCTLRFFYAVTLGRDDVPESIAPVKQPRTLPVVLSSDEVVRFFAAISHLKHRAILMTAYAAGLRVSEVARLRVADIDSQRGVIRVDQGKGRKDRYVMLSPRLLLVLRQYWKVVRPRDYLFPGKLPEKPIAPGTVLKACHRACHHAGLDQDDTGRTPRQRCGSAQLDCGRDHRTIVFCHVRRS